MKPSKFDGQQAYRKLIRLNQALDYYFFPGPFRRLGNKIFASWLWWEHAIPEYAVGPVLLVVFAVIAIYASAMLYLLFCPPMVDFYVNFVWPRFLSGLENFRALFLLLQNWR